jgi:hypothetical protein
MWVLWFVLTVNGITHHTPLDTYMTKILCEISGVEVLNNMQLAYPEDLTMRYYCQTPPALTKGR